MKQLNAYLTFEGNCREAMTFYAKCLGAELHLSTFGESNPNAPPETKDRIMHSQVSKGPAVLMASDNIPGRPLKAGDNISVAIQCDSQPEIDGIFAAEGPSLLAVGLM